jgi:hypothetical protein
MLIPATFTFVLIEQLPRPPPSKLAISAKPGTLAPPAPPEVVDQLALVFQLLAEAATQYRFAACASLSGTRKAAAKRIGTSARVIFRKKTMEGVEKKPVPLI